MSLDLSVLATASGNGVKTGTASSVGGKTVLPKNAGKDSAFAQLLNANAQSGAQHKTAGKTATKAGAINPLLQNTGLKTQGLQNDLVAALKVSKGDDEGENALIGLATLPANTAAVTGKVQPQTGNKSQTGKTKLASLSSLSQTANGTEQKNGKPNAQPHSNQIRRSVEGGAHSRSPQPAKTPAITAGPIIAELDTKGGLAPQPSTTPAIQSGPIVAGLNPKNVTTPQPSTAPAIGAGPVLAGLDPKNITSPQPSTTPAIQSGPIVAELNPKNVTTPQPSTAPAIGAGPVLAGLDPKNITSPQPSTTPAIQSGPIVAELNPKNVTAPQKSGTPAIKAGAVIAGQASDKNTTAQLSGLMQSLSAPEELQSKTARARRSGHASTKGSLAKGGQAQAAGKAGAVNPAAQAANAGNASAGTAPIISSNTLLAQVASNLSYNPQGGDIAGSSSQNGAPSSFAGITDAGLDGRTMLAGTQTDHMIKATQTHDIAQKGASLSQHNSPRLDQASLAGFAANMAQRVQGGGTRFEIRLDPAELGKVHVKLEVSADNRVEAVLSSHRPEVLADLQRGADALRRALSDMGFDLGSGGLSFSLEQGSGGFGTDQDSTPGQIGMESIEPDESVDTHSSILAQSNRGYGLTRVFAGRVDVRL